MHAREVLHVDPEVAALGPAEREGVLSDQHGEGDAGPHDPERGDQVRPGLVAAPVARIGLGSVTHETEKPRSRARTQLAESDPPVAPREVPGRTWESASDFRRARIEAIRALRQRPLTSRIWSHMISISFENNGRSRFS